MTQSVVVCGQKCADPGCRYSSPGMVVRLIFLLLRDARCSHDCTDDDDKVGDIHGVAGCYFQGIAYLSDPPCQVGAEVWSHCSNRV